MSQHFKDSVNKMLNIHLQYNLLQWILLVELCFKLKVLKIPSPFKIYLERNYYNKDSENVSIIKE